MDEPQSDDYGLSRVPTAARIVAPELDYRPRDPLHYRPPIGLIGCGAISAYHLAAYRRAGYNVVALCDLIESRARDRQAEFYPDARVYTNYRDLLRRDEIEVVDIATHPADREPILEDALHASKHVLSHKPFVLDLPFGRRLVDLADRQGVKLAVNQNGRWAPHFAYLRQLAQQGILGDLTSAAFTVHWDHTWVIETPFNDIPDLILYDFAIHWFDAVTSFFGDQRPLRLFASTARAAGQRARPPLLAQVAIEYETAQATLAFDATVVHGQEDRTFLAGTKGSVVSSGPSLSEQRVILTTVEGTSSPKLEGTWFREGFHGTMGELLCAIEEDREPLHGARGNLRSLELAFAAIASAREGVPKVPGQVDRLPTS
ncbi:MAG TPA: Gfo/Idh/MocA family oxidoreductase [Chloroflexota bacterium]|nr:Gfo/Idh/MocA family oxidoreductase [Chloroflexota bacterium]